MASAYTQRLAQLLRDYPTYSTISGLVFLSKPDQSRVERVFWPLVIVSMISIGFYSSWSLYDDWINEPVLTNVKTTALHISQVPFPAVTICTPGLDNDVFKAAFIQMYIETERQKGNGNFASMPIEYAKNGIFDKVSLGYQLFALIVCLSVF